MTSGVHEQWARWSLEWFIAADWQAERGRRAPSMGDRETELLMFVAALRNSLRGARRVLGSGSHHLQRFKKAVPNLETVRDMIEHFDAYIEGTGNLQQGEQLPWRTMISGAGDSHTLSVLWGSSAAENYAVLDVDVDRSLAETAPLVAAALKRAGITAVSPVVEKYL